MNKRYKSREIDCVEVCKKEMMKFSIEYTKNNNASLSYNMLVAYACEQGKNEWVEALRRRKVKCFMKTYLRSSRQATGLPYGMSAEESASIAMLAMEKYENKLLVEAEERAHKAYEESLTLEQNKE